MCIFTIVLMPKAAMNKNYLIMSAKNNVWFSWQVFWV
jgi:hypothetical protein